MTPPIPLGAPRQRPAKSCTRCRQSKAACKGWTDLELAAAETDPVAFKATGKKCKRCERLNVECEFLPSRRKGRPRRIGEKTMDQSASPEPVHLPSPSESGSPSSPSTSTSHPAASPSAPLEASRAPISARNDLAAAYLAEIHPYAPLLPPTLDHCSDHLAAAGAHLQVALRMLLRPRTASVADLPNLRHFEPDITDVQAVVLSVFLLYGIGQKTQAKVRLRWASQQILATGWTGSAKSEGYDNLNAAGWLCWQLEIQLGVLTGQRDRVLGHHVSPALDDSSESLQRQALLLLFTATEPLSLDPAAAHEHAQTLINQSFDIYERALAAYTITRDESAFMSGLASSAATVFLLSSSSIFSNFAASAFACGIDSTSRPPPSAHHLIVGAARQIMTLLRLSLDPTRPAPVHSPFFGCSLLVAVRGLLIGDEDERQRDVSTTRDIKLAERVLEAQAVKWEEAKSLLSEVGVLQRVLLV